MDSGVDDLLELMDAAGIPRTREDYIAVAWGDDPPEPWTAEIESELPEDLQDWSLFVATDDGAKLQEKQSSDWTRREFNPDEPRDEDGKWTDGGGSDGGGDSGGGGGGGGGTTAVDWKELAHYHGLPVAERNAKEPVYLRVGAWNPDDPRSHNYALGDVEAGLSVYELNGFGEPIVPPEGEWAAEDLDARLKSDAPKFLVQGQLVGVGHDGEPLLSDPNVIGGYRSKQKAFLRKFNPDEPRDEQGRWTDGGGSDGGSDSAGVEFVSPSVASHLDFHEAVSGLKSPQQKALREASAAIDEALHEKTTAYNIIGAWSDGAENSVASFHPKSDFERLRVSGAMKGHLADQKQVLIFQQHAGKTAGDAVLYNFEAKGSLADIHQNLLEDGIAFHTLVPNSGGATVLVADLDGSMADAVEKGSARYDAQVGVRFGQAEFIGTTKEDGSDREQRDSARASYEKIIAESPVQGSGEIWRRVRDTYGEASVGADTIPGYKPGIQAVNDDSKIKATKAEWITGSPIKTIEQAVGAAGAAQDALGKAGEAIASKLGVDFKNPGPKSKSEKGIARIKEKAALRGGRVAAVTDIARATFVVNDPKQVDVIAADLGKKFEVTLENWRKNDQGYLDRTASVRFGNGLIGEVQFMDPGMSDAKSDTGGNGHGLYAEWRALDMSKPAEREKADKLVGQMRALYGKVTSGYSSAWRAAIGAAM